MIEIEIDCNSDVIRLKDEGGKLIIEEFNIKYPDKFIDLFSEVFNRITSIQDSGFIGVLITKIDEDNKTTVGEW